MKKKGKKAKRKKINKFLYIIHLEPAEFWVNTWHVIEKYIDDKLELEMQNKYKSVDNILKKFSEKNK